MMFFCGEKLFCHHLKQVCASAKNKAFIKSFVVMEGWSYLISIMINLCKCLLRIPLNQSVTVFVFLHWFKFMASRIFLFAVSKFALLIRPIFFYMIFQSYQAVAPGGYFHISNQFSSSLLFKIRFPWILISFFMLLLVLLYFEVMALRIIWSYSNFVNR